MSSSKQFRPATPELVLSREHDRPYGIRQTGWVVTDDKATPITLRRPHDNSESVVVFVNGWTAALNSMRTPAIEAVRAGHNAVTFGFSNTDTKEALEENAKETASVMRALPKKWEQSVMGLSMGGRVAIMAMLRPEVPDQRSATLVASAGFLPRDPSLHETVQHLYQESSELVSHYLTHPLTVARVGYSAARHVVRRPWAIGAEILELTHGSVHDDVKAIKAKRSAPDIHFAYGDRDRLIPAWAQEEGIIDMPFDSVWKYPGGHTELIVNPRIARQLLSGDYPEPSQQSLPLAA